MKDRDWCTGSIKIQAGFWSWQKLSTPWQTWPVSFLTEPQTGFTMHLYGGVLKKNMERLPEILAGVLRTGFKWMFFRRVISANMQ